MFELTPELRALLPEFKTPSDAITGLHLTLFAATKATISLLDVGVQEIEGGRYGPLNDEDKASIKKLSDMRDRLKAKMPSPPS